MRNSEADAWGEQIQEEQHWHIQLLDQKVVRAD
jgi:hypothetical protein